MSELINTNDNRATIRWKLLTGASALALTAYVSSTDIAGAEDANRPQVWIEFGGQMESVQGPSTPFIAPFMTAITPTPDVYANDIFTVNQKPNKLAFGAEGSVSFQPEGSDWIFSAAIKFGRSQAHRHMHEQGPEATNVVIFPSTTFVRTFFAAPFADEKGSSDESHAILDFQAGRDVGLGAFGTNGTSLISVGVRIAQFLSKSDVNAKGRPQINVFPSLGARGAMTFHNYTMTAHAERSFHGVGPSLSWNASASIAGNVNDGELTLDWGIDGAVLFGRQKAKNNHTTQAYHLPTPGVAYYPWYQYRYYAKTYQRLHHATRSRRVTVANLGGFAGVSFRYTNAKVSLGYRYDTFIGAMDTGIDAAKKSNVTFNGPYASISIGLGD